MVSFCVAYCNMFGILDKVIIRQSKVLKNDFHIHHIKIFFFCIWDLNFYSAVGILGAKSKYKQEITYIEIG